MEDIIRYHASSFARSTGIEEEDLTQEARLAAYLAASDGRYDPCKASLATYASTRVYRHLCQVNRKEARHPRVTCELDEDMPLDAPSPEDVTLFWELIRQLPEDARTVVDLVLGNAPAVANLSPMDSKQIVAETLGWPRARLREAYGAVTGMLGGAIVA